MAGYGPTETTLDHDISADSKIAPKDELPWILENEVVVWCLACCSQ